MAGLTAARALAAQGQRVLVLEARDRVGGRVWSQRASSGDVVELGAEFVHGRAAELWSLIEESGVTPCERHGVMLRLSGEGGLAEDDDGNADMFAPLEQLEDFSGDDIDFASWLRSSNVSGASRTAVTSYVEGFNAADATKISVRSLGVQQKAEDAIEGSRSWHVRGGYVQLADYLAAQVRTLGSRIELACPVDRLTWRPGSVEVSTPRGTFRAPRCVITLPLGVLQQVNREHGLRIQPEPAALAHARRLAMGHALRITLVFRSRWWERSGEASASDLARMSFLFSAQHLPSVWWTARTEAEPAPTLTGWVGGPRSRALAGLDADALADQACRTLAEIFRIDLDEVRDELLSAHSHDWDADPYARGAYSYVAAGGMDAPAAMTRPESETLYFAGEHTDITGHWGTVHAAVRSGLRVAQQLLQAQSPGL